MCVHSNKHAGRRAVAIGPATLHFPAKARVSPHIRTRMVLAARGSWWLVQSMQKPLPMLVLHPVMSPVLYWAECTRSQIALVCENQAEIQQKAGIHVML